MIVVAKVAVDRVGARLGAAVVAGSVCPQAVVAAVAVAWAA